MSAEQIVSWILGNWEIIAAVVVAVASVDGLAGAIPDKYLPYVGLVRRIILAVVKALTERKQ